MAYNSTQRDGASWQFRDEWHGDCYDVHMYLTTEQRDGSCTTQVLKSRYHAVTTDRLQPLMRRAGLQQVQRIDNVLFLPVRVGRRPWRPIHRLALPPTTAGSGNPTKTLLGHTTDETTAQCKLKRPDLCQSSD
ncbi:hypothetical protein C0Q88_26000 [Ralstonia pickettii]|uniref:Uncharacterized protein n=1 Tax=Ralstonia pickettii TaxID=329 RepID=A0A2N4TJG9_RALPI|nr:hypothetical protein [Ralstonia pickettii]PLC39855.1 hypothetical protein C0Q88_26000 [Ralstonia pickettii]